MALKKKMLAAIAAMATTSALTINAMAAGKTAAIFDVDDDWVAGFVQYFDSTGGNPFDSDLVRASTTSDEKMDTISAFATLYYTKGNEIKKEVQSFIEYDSKGYYADAIKYTFATGFKGTGDHFAERNGIPGSDSTIVLW